MATAPCFGYCLAAVRKSDALDPMGSVFVAAWTMMLSSGWALSFFPLRFLYMCCHFCVYQE